MKGGPWTVVVTPRSIDLDGTGLGLELAQANCVVRRVAGAPLSSEKLAEAWADADGAILGLDVADRTALRAARSLKAISRYGVGYDNVDVAAATESGVVVTITPAAPTTAVAEFTIALILAMVRGLPALLSGARSPTRPAQELAAMTMGIIGLGRIGRAVARRGLALGMTVTYFDPASPAPEVGYEPRELGDLLRVSDVVSLHVPLTPATRRMIGRSELACMKRTAYLVNTARGGLVDEMALNEALRNGTLGGAALDVREAEPTPLDDPLRSAPNVILTAHVASRTLSSTERMAREAVANLLALKRGEIPATALNPAAARNPR